MWEKTDQKGGKPKLVYENHAMPVFYRDVMYREDEARKDAAYLKLYDGHDWKWFHVRLSHTDMEYLRKNWSGKRHLPNVREKTQEIFSAFFLYRRCDTYESTSQRTDHLQCGSGESIRMQSVPLCGQTELSWEESLSILPSEKDRMYRVLGRIRRFQRKHGSVQAKSRWAYAKRLNIELGRKIAGAVTGYAEENHADVIVFEYLEIKRKDIRKKETEAASVGEKGYPEKM